MYDMFKRYGEAYYARRAMQKRAELAKEAVEYLANCGVFGKTAAEVEVADPYLSDDAASRARTHYLYHGVKGPIIGGAIGSLGGPIGWGVGTLVGNAITGDQIPYGWASKKDLIRRLKEDDMLQDYLED